MRPAQHARVTQGRLRSGGLRIKAERTVHGIPKKTTLSSGDYLRNRSTLDIGVLGYIGIV